jgi:predicted nucleotidyltransferase
MTAGLQGHEPTTTVSAIRRRKRDARISLLRQQACDLLKDHPNADLWLFGSWARGDWDAFSDVDLLAIAPSRGEANRLAEAVLDAGMADDVLALTELEWQERRNGDDPYWSAIGRDALRLNQP